MTSQDPSSEKPVSESEKTTEEPREELPTPGEVRVRFGMYGAGVMMVLCFAFQAFFRTGGSQTQRITELGIIMFMGFIVGWVFARLRF